MLLADQQNLMLAVSGAASAETLSRLMANWHRGLKQEGDAELMAAIGFFMRMGDWEGAGASITSAFGRWGGPYRQVQGVLQAATQRMRLLNRQGRRMRALGMAWEGADAAQRH